MWHRGATSRQRPSPATQASRHPASGFHSGNRMLQTAGKCVKTESPLPSARASGADALRTQRPESLRKPCQGGSLPPLTGGAPLTQGCPGPLGEPRGQGSQGYIQVWSGLQRTEFGRLSLRGKQKKKQHTIIKTRSGMEVIMSLEREKNRTGKGLCARERPEFKRHSQALVPESTGTPEATPTVQGCLLGRKPHSLPDPPAGGQGLIATWRGTPEGLQVTCQVRPMVPPPPHPQ